MLYKHCSNSKKAPDGEASKSNAPQGPVRFAGAGRVITVATIASGIRAPYARCATVNNALLFKIQMGQRYFFKGDFFLQENVFLFHNIHIWINI